MADRAANVRSRAYAALENRGRSASVPRGSENDRAVTRRAASVETRDTNFGRQSSAEDSPEDEEDSSAGVEAGSSSADVGAGSSSADVEAGSSSADVGAGRLRPATATSGTSHPNPTAPYPNLNPTVPSTTLTKTELVAQTNEFLRENNKQTKIRLAVSVAYSYLLVSKQENTLGHPVSIRYYSWWHNNILSDNSLRNYLGNFIHSDIQ
jgi:hypothetical protein